MAGVGLQMVMMKMMGGVRGEGGGWWKGSEQNG